ncbi:MAG: AAA family ATPase [Candidatus Ranarchaeia archaeon]
MTKDKKSTITKIPTTEGIDLVIETSKVDRPDLPEIKKLMLEPVGYPLRTGADKQHNPLFTDNIELFQAYAREQWRGTPTSKDEFLFDRGLFPDYAFKIIQSKPKKGKITEKTLFQLKVKMEPVIQQEFPKILLKEVVGHKRAKEKCKIILEFLKNPKKFGDWAPKNILFYGPPGTGKTLVAKALAGEAKTPIFMIKATELLGMHVGEGAKHVHSLFTAAKNIAPSIIFIDEVDAIALDRKFQSVRGDVTEVVNALLSELGGLDENTGIVTIAATNTPEIVDNAVNSRFEELIEFGLPDEKDRQEIFQLYAKKLPLTMKVDFKKLSEATKGLSGRDIKERILKTALHKALLRKKKTITDEILNEIVDSLINNEDLVDKSTEDLYS